MSEQGNATECSENSLRPQLPVCLPLLEKKRESESTATLFFPLPEPRGRGGPDHESLNLGDFVPGQFLMLWLPRVDEKPYTASYLEGGRIGITVLKRGRFSSMLHELPEGTLVGLRGPYGRGFRGMEGLGAGDGVALLGGGCGMATLALLRQMLPESTLVQGARTEGELLYRERFPQQVIFTEDGSAGRRGFPTEWLRQAADAGQVRMVYACGPEAMLAAVVSVCGPAGMPCQVSLERYMKCGFGVCGQCECDGLRVCVEGPVFGGDELLRMPSFGKTARDKCGRTVTIPEFGQCATPSPPGQS